jgi:transcriptional regulator with PAS, ATPase and Fis domain
LTGCAISHFHPAQIAELKGVFLAQLRGLLDKLKISGKVEQFEVYKEIFSKYFSERDITIFTFYDKFLVLLGEYLIFDAKPDERIKKLISENYEIVFSFIRSSNNLKVFEKYYPSYERYNDYITDASSKAKILQYLGYFCWMKQDFELSKKFLKESLEIANNKCDVDEIPGRYTNLGYIYECSGDMDQAEYYYNAGLDFAKKHNSENSIKMAYDAMGRLNLSRDNFNKAINYFEESLKLYREENDLNKVSVQSNLACAYLKNGEHIKAKKYFKQIHQKWIKDANPELYFAILANSASNLRKLSEYKISEKYYLESVEYAESQKAIEQLGSGYLNLGIIYSCTDRNEKASEFYHRALEISQKTNNEKLLLSVYTNLGELKKNQQLYKNAISYFNKAILLSKKQKNIKNLVSLLKMLAACFEETNEFEKALTVLKEFNQVNEEYLMTQNQKEKELEENPLVGKGRNQQYFFKESNSLISRELTQKIGSALIGRNPSMQKVINQAILAAGNNDCSILIRGESGTGKEIVAKMIHYSSLRSKAPFVAVNSAAFTSGIAPSALFGHLKGSFTGASSRQIGHFEAANTGTIFFDEIGDMPLDIQSTLLRVLEEKAIHPVGAHKSIKVDFRLISATHNDIYDRVHKGVFRLDFLNRINTLEIVIPPLRERKDDIPILIDYFLDEIGLRLGADRPTISVSALKMLCDFDYPGNVRELSNTIEKLVLFCKKNEITGEDVYLLQGKNPDLLPLSRKFPTLNLESLEKDSIMQALEETNYVKTKAAELLGITSYSLLRRLKKYNIVV